MNYFEEMESELQIRYPKLFEKVGSEFKSLLANKMIAFLDIDSDESSYCSFIDVYMNKQDAISAHIDCVKHNPVARMLTVSEKFDIYLVYAIDP